MGTGHLAVFRSTKYGVQGTGMAPWDGRMNDEETWEVVNYVRTLQRTH
jgi:mono/diheme cytochrome c family protein